MIVTLVGFSHYDFNTDDGKHLVGDTLHVLREADPHDKNFHGQKVDVIGTPQGFEAPVLEAGKKYEIYFDKGRQGKAVLAAMIPATAARTASATFSK